jgi:LysR family transcriptional regulator, cyn operon transcriptional activator
MELRHLRYFIALAETLSFTRAAERVHVTQSTLSHQIHQLEEEIGRGLFERVGRRVLLTPAGENFLGYASRALREVDQGVSELMRNQTELSGEVNIGTTHTFNYGFVPQCVATFLQEHPTVKVSVQELAAEVITRKLLDGTLDVGIGYEAATAQEQLWFEPLYTEELVLIVSTWHPLAHRKRIRLVELHRQSMVLLPQGFATRMMLDECFRACGAQPQVAVEMNTIEPMIELVARTRLAGIISMHAMPESEELRLVLLESPTPLRTPGILWKLGTARTQIVNTFVSILRRQGSSRNVQSEE